MTDKYTKTVLTVIAAILVVLVAKEFSPTRPAHAQSATNVYLDGVSPLAFRYGPVPVKCVDGCR